MSTFEERIAKAVTDKLNDGTVEELVSDAVTKALKSSIEEQFAGTIQTKRRRRRISMAKIFKVSGYLVDPIGDYPVDYLKRDIETSYDMIGQHIHVEEADIGKWNSESSLNYDNCDLADCEKYFKRKVPVDNDRNVTAGQVYRHFKGQTVKVLHISQDTEAPGQFYVVYECEDGAIWSRPYGMFVSEVDHVKYPNVKQKYRFELVGEDDAN